MAGCVTKPAASNWKQLLLSAIDSNYHLKHSNYFQLATVTTNGRPANRTVVFRGFLENSDSIQINTDARSSKIEEIRRCSYAEVCWYFTDSWEQFRINGGVDIIGSNCLDPIKLQHREKAWFLSSLKSRFQYLGPEPHLPCSSSNMHQESQLNECSGPVDAFCLLILDPEQVDYVNLKSNERMIFMSRIKADGNKEWLSEKVNP